MLFQNLLFWPLFLLATTLFILVAVPFLAVASCFESRRRIMYRLRRIIRWYGRTVIACGWPFVRVEYRDWAPEDNLQSIVFVCNHRSAMDAFFFSYSPVEGVQIAKSWVLRLPVYGVLARLAGYLSIHDLSLSEFYRRAGQLLDEGVCLGTFPEGTRSRGRSMGPFNSAVFRLIQQKKATVIPMTISGSEKVMPKGAWFLRPGRVRLDKLPALPWPAYCDLTVFKLKNTVRETIDRHLRSIEEGSPESSLGS